MTPLGDAMAHIVIDDGPDHHLKWVAAIIETGEFWTFNNPAVRLWTNITEGRLTVSPFGKDIVDQFDFSFRNS